MTSDFDFIIVGQGIAGSLLAHELIDSGKKLLVIDKFQPFSSSRIAAGIIHPITGRRLAKSWMADELIPFAEKRYKDLGAQLNEQFYSRIDILEVLHSIREQNDWNAKQTEPGFGDYLDNKFESENYSPVLKPFRQLVRIKKSGWLNLSMFLDASLKRITDQGTLFNEEFVDEACIAHPDGIEYNKLKAKAIIYCEGWNASKNPLWSWLPFSPAKGELLTIHAPDFPETNIINRGIFILPLGNHLFRVGSTFSWNELNSETSDAARHAILEKLDQLISVPYEVIEHVAGVRPSNKDRRPFIGEHPTQKKHFIFNGLGSKGVLLAPYFAKQLADHLLNGTKINPEADISRYENLFHKRAQALE